MTKLCGFYEHDTVLKPLLNRLSYFSTITPDEVHQLLQLIVDRRQYARGDLMLKIGQKTDKVFFFIEGWAANEIITSEGNSCIISFLLPGEASSINSSLDACSDVSIKCLTEVSVVSVRGEDLKGVLAENRSLRRSFSLMRMACDSMNRELLVNLLAKPADYKVAHLLCELSLREGLANPNGGPTSTLRLTQLEMGAALGISAVHVNRVIGRLQREGLLEVQQSRMIEIDREALAKKYSFSSSYITQYDTGKKTPSSPGRVLPFTKVSDDN